MTFFKLARTLALCSILFFAAGCGSSSDTDFVATTGTSNTALTTDLFGRVYLTEEASGAFIEILSASSEEVLLTLTSDNTGSFIIPRGTRLPSRFRVAANAPEGVRVERFVDLAERTEHLWLNVPSSMMSAYKISHPEVPLGEIEAELKTVLGMEPNEGFGGLSSRPGSPFSHRLFLERADGAGGAEALVQSVIADIDGGGTVSFAAPERVVGSTVQVAPRLVRAQFGEVLAGAGLYLFEQTASKAFDKVLGESVNEFGKLTGLSGLNFGTTAKYDQVIQDLTDIEDDLQSLTAEVNSEYLDTLKTVDLGNFDSYLTSVTSAYDNLMMSAQTYSDDLVATGQQDDFDHGPNIPAGLRSTASTAFVNIVGSNATGALNLYLNNTDASLNLLSLAAQTASGDLVTNTSEVTSAYAFYPYRYDSTTDGLRNNFGMYEGNALLIATLNSENGNALYLPQELLNGGQGDPYSAPAAGLNSALSQNNNLAEILAEAELRSVPGMVGTDLVFVDVVNQKMWYLTTGLYTYDEVQNHVINFSLSNWGYPEGYATSANGLGTCPSDPDSFHDFNRPSSLVGFRVPESSELVQLHNILAQVDSNAPGDAGKTYDALVKLGFTGLEDPASDNDDNYKKYWCNDHPPEDEGTFGTGTTYKYYDMKDNTIRQEDRADGSISPDDGSPDWTGVFVRDIQPSNLTGSPDYGDTGDQAVRVYGYSPNHLDIEQVATTTQGIDGFASVVSYRATARMGDSTTSSNVTDLVTWTLTDSSGNELSDPPAYLRYQNTGTQNDSNTVDVVYTRQNEEVHLVGNLRSFRTTPVAVGSEAGVVPQVTAIAVTPQNVLLQGIPTSNTSMQYYCTGYLATGETVDLTKSVAWTLETQSGGTIPTAITNGNDGGILLFGSEDSLSDTMTVKATYSGQGDNDSRGIYGASFSQTSVVEVPARN